jgi:hypothetical protein
MGAARAARDAALVSHGNKQLEVNQIETHAVRPRPLPSSRPKAGSITPRLCLTLRSVNVNGCPNPCYFSSRRLCCLRVSSRA